MKYQLRFSRNTGQSIYENFCLALREICLFVSWHSVSVSDEIIKQVGHSCFRQLYKPPSLVTEFAYSGQNLLQLMQTTLPYGLPDTVYKNLPSIFPFERIVWFLMNETVFKIMI